LNVDETENIDKTWDDISKAIGIETEIVKKAIQTAKDIYIILDHTRSVMMTI
jgi:alanyl-tRNA synthetase